MGTRSDIIVHRTDGKWARVYCHWDGYLDHNGQILFEHYETQSKAEELIAPGDMSSLSEKCSKPDGHSYETPVKGYTIYYGRDRGEKKWTPRLATRSPRFGRQKIHGLSSPMFGMMASGG